MSADHVGHLDRRTTVSAVVAPARGGERQAISVMTGAN
jgi:hypothetical protein